MLNVDTRRRLDTARDILVGKVPDPKSQVEQITIALVYKFMDDMDQQSLEMGGKASFFTGEYARYAWRSIFDPRLGGQEMLGLYADAITSMSQNANLPQLFRDIFRNAFLPYRDPETLKLFLKTINEFSYDTSEHLGDAFEYLLRVLGAQGDAGQFLTPRHIIEFMVQVVKPQKNESILDPACGTAGFLIASYRYILENNKNHTPGDALIPEERSRLLANFTGYDISPDMTRLSRVNLFLHNFQDPKIYEYDTLTSVERWNDYADVIMANPPFMSPKGGIRPHKRFSVQSNRSEVLFVDYIAEHLTPTGRAAVIVPEGIIFQSANAYKQLRKYLVEKDFLWAVVSLPAGVFNPYSGVKTSILFFDRALAKKTDQILFVKVAADGFGLGAQRKENGKNDLPDALAALETWQKAVREGDPISFDPASYPSSPILVGMSRLAENGDYNLSADRYRENLNTFRQKYPLVAIGDICTFEYGKPLKAEFRVEGPYPVYGSNGQVGFHNEYLVEGPFLVIGRKGSAGEVHYSANNGYPIDTTFFIKLDNETKILLKYLYHILKCIDLKNVNTQAGVPGLNRNDAYNIKIPLPPLEIQRQIVDEIAGYQRVIDGARQIIDEWKPNISFELNKTLLALGRSSWQTIKLNEICDINSQSANPVDLFGKIDFIYVDISSIEKDTGIINLNNKISTENAPSRARRIIIEKDVLVSTVRPNLKAFALVKNIPDHVIVSTGFAVLRSKETVLPEFLYFSVLDDYAVDQMIQKMGKGAYPSINQTDVEEINIFLPPISVQKEIVNRIEHERQIIEGNRELIRIYEEKIQNVIHQVWEG